MKKTFLLSCLVLPLLGSCGFEKEIAKIERKSTLINKYEIVALKLAKENRELNSEVKRLEFEIQNLKQASGFSHSNLADKHEDKHVESKVGHSRAIASVKPVELKLQKDLVEFKTYKWSADDMLKIADKEFKDKNFEKAAQYYTSLINYYPTFKQLDDEFYFKAGISAYESGVHHEWTLKHFSVLMDKWPTSQYFRSAKLWVGLTHMKMGDNKKFFATVEEFRKKYRNPNEWSILSSYYEKIEEKTNE